MDGNSLQKCFTGSVKEAKIVSHNDTFVVKSSWKQLNLGRMDYVEYQMLHSLSVNNDEIVESLQLSPNPLIHSFTFGPDGENKTKILWTIENPANQNVAVCVNYKSSLTCSTLDPVSKLSRPLPGTFVELWSKNLLISTLKLPCSGSDAKHGPVHPFPRSDFSAAAWSPNGEQIIYIAEAPFNHHNADSYSIDQSVFRTDWGEAFTDVSQPIVCLLDVTTGNVVRLDEELPDWPKAVSVNHIEWSPDGKGLVLAVYINSPDRLGPIYCFKRPSSIYYVEIESQSVIRLNQKGRSVRSPRFNPDGSRLIWLESSCLGPHCQCHSIVCKNWPPSHDTNPDILVPVVDLPSSQDAFPGLYHDLPARCWSDDGRFLLSTTQWGFSSVVICIDVGSTLAHTKPQSILALKSPLDQSLNGRQSCVTILDVQHDFLLVSASSIIDPPRLYACRLTACIAKVKTSSSDVCFVQPDWTLLASSNPTPLSAGLTYSVSSFQPSNGPCQPALPEFLLAKPASPGGKLLRGLIIYPHGGPHSAFSSTWSPIIASFLNADYACLLINYRGSVGYGQQFILSLPGHIGDYDLEDCVTATKIAQDELASDGFSPNLPTVLFGGSHGGYLALQLAGKRSDLFNACVVRNPVTNLVSMLGTTDIPDWCFTESDCGEVEEQFGRLPTESDLSLMWNRSPLNLLGQQPWSIPLLLLLGLQDRRVPSSQGLEFARKLKARNPQVSCEVVTFPVDRHSLESAFGTFASASFALDWFNRYLPTL